MNRKKWNSFIFFTIISYINPLIVIKITTLLLSILFLWSCLAKRKPVTLLLQTENCKSLSVSIFSHTR